MIAVPAFGQELREMKKPCPKVLISCSQQERDFGQSRGRAGAELLQVSWGRGERLEMGLGGF